MAREMAWWWLRFSFASEPQEEVSNLVVLHKNPLEPVRKTLECNQTIDIEIIE